MLTKRHKKQIVFCCTLLFCCALYFIWLRNTGVGIPCLFHLFTGKLCPGCGISRAVVALSHGQILLALRCNAMILILLPIFLWLFVCSVYQSLRYGHLQGSHTQDRVILLCCVLLILFGILRNIPFFWFLQPPV